MFDCSRLKVAGDSMAAQYCVVCKVWLNGPPQYADHLKGYKHRKNLANQRAEERASGSCQHSDSDDPSGAGQCSGMDESIQEIERLDHGKAEKHMQSREAHSEIGRDGQGGLAQFCF